MAKKDDMPVDQPGFEEKIEERVEMEAVELAAPRPHQPLPPTEAQHAWMRAHPRHIRTSHIGMGRPGGARYVDYGTLHPDGTFVSVLKHPVTEGNGAFGVGIPLGG